MIVVVGKQLFGCFVGWLPGLFLKSGRSQGQPKFQLALSSKTSLLPHIQPMDPLRDYPNSCIGCIKINYDCLQVGGAVQNNQKYFCSLIPMKLWDMMEYVFIKM
jgi:hypothetical protein